MCMSVIIGEKVILREYQQADIEYILNWVNDPEITSTLGSSFIYPKTRNSTEKFLNTIMDGKAEIRGFVIADINTFEYIGQIDLFDFDWYSRSVSLQIVIGRKKLHRKGYGSEALRLLRDFCFNTLNMNRIELEVYSFNRAAYNCYVKCGFKEEGILREKVYRDGKYYDSVIMSILKSECLRSNYC